MSTRNNKRGYVKPVLTEPVEETKLMTEEQVVAQEEFINETPLVEEPNSDEPEVEEKIVVEETREELINRLVEEQALIFDEDEEKFLNSTAEEIESQPVTAEEPCVCDETCVCDEPCVCTDPSCACEAKESATVLEEVKPLRKTFAQMTATELNIYHKTGILPLL